MTVTYGKSGLEPIASAEVGGAAPSTGGSASNLEITIPQDILDGSMYEVHFAGIPTTDNSAVYLHWLNGSTAVGGNYQFRSDWASSANGGSNQNYNTSIGHRIMSYGVGGASIAAGGYYESGFTGIVRVWTNHNIHYPTLWAWHAEGTYTYYGGWTMGFEATGNVSAHTKIQYNFGSGRTIRHGRMRLFARTAT